jgi:hypothetical protein
MSDLQTPPRRGGNLFIKRLPQLALYELVDSGMSTRDRVMTREGYRGYVRPQIARESLGGDNDAFCEAFLDLKFQILKKK